MGCRYERRISIAMNKEIKFIEDIQPLDIMNNPVWQYLNSDRIGETAVYPIKKLPVARLTGRLVGTVVRLANGQQRWALIGNVDPNNARLTQHFLTLSIEDNGKWFVLARYHDINYFNHGPEALARFLDLQIDEVFPISYDIARFCKGNPEALKGFILKEPKEKLTRAQIIALAVP